MPNFSLPPEVFRRAAAQFQTPFYLYDEAGIRKTIRALQAAFSWAGDFKEYFAVKALPNPQILRIFREEGCGLDCSSETELMMAERLGFAGDDIVFSANAMPPAEFAHARRLGAHINLDDISDIDTLLENGGVPESVCVRYNPGGEFSLGTSVMGRPSEAKYGWTRAQLTEGLSRLKALGVRRFGLHAFLASNTTSDSYYPTLAGILFRTGREVSRETGLPLSFVDLSGGVGIAYKPEDSPADIRRIGEDVRREHEAAFGADAAVGVKTELGRYMTGPHGWLVARAMHEKKIYKHYIGLDACAVNLLRPAMYGAYHHVTVVGKERAPATQTYDITGSLCENNDKFAVNRRLPPIEMGDLVVLHDAGAHGFSMGYNYNGRLRSAEVLYTCQGDFRLIRRAETPQDYFRTLEGFWA